VAVKKVGTNERLRKGWKQRGGNKRRTSGVQKGAIWEKGEREAIPVASINGFVK